MNSIRCKIRFHQPEKLLPLLGREKNKENWFTPNFSNAFQQQKKKALNKSTRFKINPKPVYTGRDEGFDENSVSTSRKMLLPLARIFSKIQENGFNEQEQCCFFFWKKRSTFNFKNGDHQQKKALNKRKRFALNQKPFPLARKILLKNTISVDQKTASI